MDNSLKVLMISIDPALAEDGLGDVKERHIYYARHLANLDIILLGGRSDKPLKLADNCTVYPTGVKGLRGYKQGLKLADKLAQQADLVDTQDPHATGKIGLAVSQKYNIPLEVHFHGDFWNNSNWLKESVKNRLYNSWQKEVVKEASGIRVVSQGIKNKLVKSGVAEEKIRVINTPVDVTGYQDVVRQDRDLKELLFIGRLVQAKNLFFTLEVIDELSKKIQDIRLKIVGQGELEGKLRKEIKSRGLASLVTLEGPKTQVELKTILSTTDLLLLLSTNESFGKVIVEAGAAGVPTLASNTTGARSIIKDGETGVLVDINDKQQTIEVLDKLLEDDVVLHRLGQAAKKDYVQRFNQQETINQIINFWKDLKNYGKA